MIKTSVIIPVYNTGAYVGECIESVYRQTQKEIEVIAINDGSTDNSYDILLKMREQHPDLIVLSQENHGLGYTRNVGLKRAKGKYVYFLDSDDYILEDLLDTCYRCAEENRLDVALFDALEFEDTKDGRVTSLKGYDRHEMSDDWSTVCKGIDFIMASFQRQIFQASACLIYCSRNFLQENNIWFLPRVYYEDNVFHCHIMMLADRVMYLPETFYQRRCRPASITAAEFDLRRARDYLTVTNAITDLKKVDREKWKRIKKINLYRLHSVVNECYGKRLYHKDARLIWRILKAWARMAW